MVLFVLYEIWECLVFRSNLGFPSAVSLAGCAEEAVLGGASPGPTLPYGFAGFALASLLLGAGSVVLFRFAMLPEKLSVA